MPAQQWRHFVESVDGGIAHQVDALRVGARALPHAARIHQGHENQAERSQLLVQHVIPAQPCQQAAQKDQQYLSADSFQAMDAAEKTDRRHRMARIAECQSIDRQPPAMRKDFVDDTYIEMRCAFFYQTFQFTQLGQFVFYVEPL